MKRLLLLATCSLASLSGMEESVSYKEIQHIVAIGTDCIHQDHADKPVGLVYTQEGFYIWDQKGLTPVKSHDTEKVFRGKKPQQIAAYAQIGGFKVSKFKNGEYVVRAGSRLQGGGVVGATAGAWFGYMAMHAIGHTVIWAVGSLAGPAAPVAIATLETTLFPFIAVAAQGCAIGCGILGGAVTGPV